MNTGRIPRWAWWALSALGLWLLWGLGIGRPLLRTITELTQQRLGMEAELAKLEARIGAVPQHVARLEEATVHVDSVIAGFHSRGDCDELLRQIRSEAQSRGLADVVVDPDLARLLENPIGEASLHPRQLQLDTVIIDLTARGRFATVGMWLDAIEERGDFRYWISCNWTALNEASTVAFAGRAALVVVHRTDSTGEYFETDVSG